MASGGQDVLSEYSVLSYDWRAKAKHSLHLWYLKHNAELAKLTSMRERPDTMRAHFFIDTLGSHVQDTARHVAGVKDSIRTIGPFAGAPSVLQNIMREELGDNSFGNRRLAMALWSSVAKIEEYFVFLKTILAPNVHPDEILHHMTQIEKYLITMEEQLEGTEVTSQGLMTMARRMEHVDRHFDQMLKQLRHLAGLGRPGP